MNNLTNKIRELYMNDARMKRFGRIAATWIGAALLLTALALVLRGLNG